jgi:hypothetical protein
MECRYYREQFIDLLAKTLDHQRVAEVENHLASCPDCRMEFETARKMWILMGEIPQPEPSASLKDEFKAVIADYKKGMGSAKKPLSEWIIRIRDYWYLQPQPRLSFSVLLLVGGLIAGYILHQPQNNAVSYNRQIDSLTSQVSDLKQLMLLSLLQNPSASQRIRAVSITNEIGNVNPKVIDALFATLNNDPDVNVRLITLEALVKLTDEPKVREGLVNSINLQESPFMQAAIAEVMVRIQEKSSVPSLQKLLDKKDLNKIAKTNIQKSITKLI